MDKQDLIEWEQYYEKKAKELLPQNLPPLTEELFILFERNGNRSVYEDVYFIRRRFLTIFGVISMKLAIEDVSSLGELSSCTIYHKLEEVLFDICREECWALPAHVNRKKDCDWRVFVDLFAAETAEALAHIAEVVRKHISEECYAFVMKNVKRRVLKPFFSKPVNTFWWEQGNNNWNAVCNGCIGSAYLHSLQSEEVPNMEYLKRINENLLYYIKGFGEDGTCMEGLGYYYYGMTYFVHYAMELYNYTEGDLDLLKGDWGEFHKDDTDKRTRIIKWWNNCYFASGKSISFSDASGDNKIRKGFFSALKLQFPEMEFGINEEKITASMENDCKRFLPVWQDYFCTKKYVAQTDVAGNKCLPTNGHISDTKKFVALESAQWCIGMADNGVGMACKGGNNGEPHNHNDVGSFLYVVDDDMLLADLGSGEYTKQYFEPETRYDILCNSSKGHSVPIIAGQYQKAGGQYTAKEFQAALLDDIGFMSISGEDTYENGLITKWNRSFQFSLNTGSLVITDVFLSDAGLQVVTETLVTQYKPEVLSDGILLQGEKSACKITLFSDDIEVERNAIRVQQELHNKLPGIQEMVYLIHWDIEVLKKRKVKIVVKPVVQNQRV